MNADNPFDLMKKFIAIVDGTPAPVKKKLPVEGGEGGRVKSVIFDSLAETHQTGVERMTVREGEGEEKKPLPLSSPDKLTEKEKGRGDKKNDRGGR